MHSRFWTETDIYDLVAFRDAREVRGSRSTASQPWKSFLPFSVSIIGKGLPSLNGLNSLVLLRFVKR